MLRTGRRRLAPVGLAAATLFEAACGPGLRGPPEAERGSPAREDDDARLAVEVDRYMRGWGAEYGPAFAPHGLLVVARGDRVVLERSYGESPALDRARVLDVTPLADLPFTSPFGAARVGTLPRALRRESGVLVPVSPPPRVELTATALELVAAARRGRASFARSGKALGSAVFFAYAADRDVSVLFFSSVVDFDVGRAGRDVLAIALTSQPATPLSERPTRPIPEARLGPLLGAYSLTAEGRAALEETAPAPWVASVATLRLAIREGRLVLELAGQRGLAVFMSADGALFAPEADVDLEPTASGITLRTPRGALAYQRTETEKAP